MDRKKTMDGCMNIKKRMDGQKKWMAGCTEENKMDGWVRGKIWMVGWI